MPRELKNYAAITVFAVPPSVNMYVRHTHNGHFKTKEAKDWENNVALACLGLKPVTADSFDVRITVCLGPGQKGDCDNFLKCVLDPLARRGMFVSRKGKTLSDSHVQRVTVEKMRSDEPRTFIMIEPFDNGRKAKTLV